MEPNTSVTSLNLSCCPSFKEVQLLQVFSQLPALRKLNLTRFNFPNMFSFKTFCSLPNLEWLAVNGCNRICGPDLSVLSSSVGKTLRYLGLADLLLCLLVKDIYLMDLASMFPVLRTLDLSGCLNITDALLVEWYVRNDESSWPKLRKLVLKNCGVSQGVVNSVRLKTRNQLLVELWSKNAFKVILYHCCKFTLKKYPPLTMWNALQSNQMIKTYEQVYFLPVPSHACKWVFGFVQQNGQIMVELMVKAPNLGQL